METGRNIIPDIPAALAERLAGPQTQTGKPVDLTRSRTLIFLEEGELDIFLVPLDKGERKGRIPVGIVRAENCRIVTGLNFPEDTNLALIAVAQPGSVYYYLDIAEAEAVSVRDVFARDCLWSQIRSYISLLSGTDSPNWLPDKAVAGLVASLEKTAPELLEIFHRKVAMVEKDDSTQIHAANRNSRDALDYGLRRLTKIFAKGASVSPASTGDRLWDACAVVFRELGLKIPIDMEWSSDLSARRVEHFCTRLSLRKRTVTLEGQWYEQPGQPFLGRMQKDNSPVALLPDIKEEGEWTIYDPATGKQERVTRDIADRLSLTGTIFYTSFPEGKVTLGVLSRIVLEMGKRDIQMILFLLLSSSLLCSVIPIFNGIIFSTVIPMADISLLSQIFILAVTFALAQGVVDYILSNSLLRLRSRVEWKLQAALWDRLLSLPVRFFRNYSTGDLTMRSLGIMQLSDILGSAVLKGILGGFFVFPSLILMFYFSPFMSVVMLGFIIMLLLVFIILGKLDLNYQKKMMEISGELQGETIQHFTGISKIRATRTENQVLDSWSSFFSAKKELYYKAAHLSKYTTLVSVAMPCLTILCMMVLVSFLFLKDPQKAMSTADFIGFSSALALSSAALAQMVTSGVSALAIIPVYQRMKPILETPCEVVCGKSSPGKISGEIQVSHVTFRYEEHQRPILEDLSFQVSFGEFVAIVGESGSGKSTLLRLLLGFEKPENGSISYDGMDLNQVDLREFRSQIGVVLQNGKLLPDSIYRNIVAGNPTLTLNDAWESARLAGCADDIAAMPMQMHTMLNTGSGGVSGGQKQRILIARALVKQPPLLFFDEATSALDNKAQAIVSQSLTNMNMTRIIIAHRLSTVRGADRILVMDRGRIIESGTYDELMELNGKFAAQARRQIIDTRTENQGL